MEEAALSESVRKRAQRSALLAQAFAIMIGSVVAGEYMMLYANDVLGLSAVSIATIVSLAPFASAMRLPALPYIRRMGLVRSLQWARVGQGLIVLSLLLTPASWVKFPTLAVLVVVFVLFRELGLGTVWQPLMRSITTTEDRGQFFARMRATFTLVNLGLSAAIAVFVGDRLTEFQYKVILAVALFGAVNSLFWSRRIPEPEKERNPDNAGLVRSVRSWMRTLRKSPLFRIPLVIALIITSSQIPIGIIYLREGLHIPANLLGANIFFATLGTVLSLLLWGRVSDTLGFRPMLIGLLWLATGLSLVLWIVPVFPVREWDWIQLWNDQPVGVAAILLYGFGNGVLNAGLGIATTSVMHYHVSKRDSLVSMNLFALIQISFQSVLVIAFGFFLQGVVIPQADVSSEYALLHFDYFKLYRSGLVPVLMLIAIPLVQRLPNLKPWFGVSDFFQVIRAQPWRSLLGSRRIYDASEAARIELARTLGDSSNPLNLQPLSELLSDPSYEVKIEAIRSLARSGSPFAGQQLQEILNDAERRGLWDYAAWGLGELGHSESVDLLIERLQPDNPIRARAMAARALGKIGEDRAVAPILQTLREEENSLHLLSSCCWALLHLNVQAEAESALNGILRLRAREERYELLSIFCRWMHISDHWLLVSDSRTSAWQSLDDFVEGMPEKWITPREDIIVPFRNRNHARIRELLKKRLKALSEEDTTIAASLLNVLHDAHDWSPLYVLATAFLLLGPQGE